MARFGKSRAIEHIFDDRVCDHRGGTAGHHIGDRPADRRNCCRAAGRVRLAGLGVNASAERYHWQRTRENRVSVGRICFGEGYLECQQAAALSQEFDVADKIERRRIEFGTAVPNRKREIWADAGRLTDRQCQGKAAWRAHLYSIIADLRSSSRNFWDSASNRLANSSSRIWRLSGESVVVCFLSQSANICRPCPVNSGGVN